MGKFIFRYTGEMAENNREAKEIEFTVPDDMDIHEFKVMCVRMASSMGYAEGSISRAFGDLVFGNENKNTIKELLDELDIKRNN